MSGNLVAVVRSVVFVLLALLVCSVAFELAGYPSLSMLQSIADGAFLSKSAWMGTLRWAFPLFISACGVLVAFRAGFFNVGIQGQFYLGAIAAAFAMHALAGQTPLLVIPLTVAGGIAGGALWALWPGILRIRSGADEVLTTLMSNFIAGLLLVYVTSGPLKDPRGTSELSATAPVDAAYRISTSQGASLTIICLVTIVGIGIWLLATRTPFGIVSGLAGRNPAMLRWQGARLGPLALSSFLISGGLAGLAGSMEYLGPSGRLVAGFMPGHGFAAIVIALVAGLSVPGVVVAAVFFGGLASASLYLPIMAGLPSSAVDVINAAIALLITAKVWPKLSFLGPLLRPSAGKSS